MKAFIKDWNMFTAGFMWAFVCGGLVATFVYSWTFSVGFDSAKELKCPDPLVEMAEYTTVVHSLDRCTQRLDENQQAVMDMRSELDHWGYVERMTDVGPDAEINCQVLLNRSLQDVWFEAEDDLYECWRVQRDECWCPFPELEP